MIAAVLVGGAAHAEPGLRTDDANLRGYLAAARAHNRALAERRIAVRRGEATRDAAHGAYLPSVDFDLRYTRVWGAQLDLGAFVNPAYAALNQVIGQPRFPTDVSLKLPLALETKVRLTQPLYAPAIGAGNRLAAAGVDVKAGELAVAEREVVAGVRTAYLGHARAALLADLLRRTRPLLEENLRVSRLLLSADKATGEVVPRAEAELAAHDQLLRAVEQQQRAAARALDQLIGAPQDQPVAVPTDLAVPDRLAVDAATLIAQARAGRGELRVLDAAHAATAASTDLVAASRRPTIALALDYGLQHQDLHIGFDDDYAAVSLVASWNLYDGGRTRAHLAEQALDAAALDVRRADQLEQISREVAAAWDAADVARQAVASATSRVASAQAAFDVVTRRYQAGAAIQLELIGTRTALLQAETDRIVAITDFHLALVELARVAQLPED